MECCYCYFCRCCNSFTVLRFSMLFIRIFRHRFHEFYYYFGSALFCECIKRACSVTVFLFNGISFRYASFFHTNEKSRLSYWAVWAAIHLVFHFRSPPAFLSRSHTHKPIDLNLISFCIWCAWMCLRAIFNFRVRRNGAQHKLEPNELNSSNANKPIIFGEQLFCRLRFFSFARQVFFVLSMCACVNNASYTFTMSCGVMVYSFENSVKLPVSLRDTLKTILCAMQFDFSLFHSVYILFFVRFFSFLSWVHFLHGFFIFFYFSNKFAWY